MKPRLLPKEDIELLKLEALGLSYVEIAKQYGVSRQAVQKRFGLMGVYVRAAHRSVTEILPWDLSDHPAKDKIKRSESFMGLRAFIRKRVGAEVSDRSELALRTFMNHVRADEVLHLDPVTGPVWVRRNSKDGTMVIRWPEDVTRDERVQLFER
ncbi:hypothetical protein ABZ791_10675 [Streptomyces huasconensis]|uniref:Uncharacterized protein n=1 Tax=Streptomyces huasconensis TaxID=1854574 RepID=A0ABV3M725_9ACTN